jgi:hypothetical protein
LNAVEGVGAAGNHGLQIGEPRAAEADDIVAVQDARLWVRVALECEQSHVGDCTLKT